MRKYIPAAFMIVTMVWISYGLAQAPYRIPEPRYRNTDSLEERVVTLERQVNNIRQGLFIAAQDRTPSSRLRPSRLMPTSEEPEDVPSRGSSPVPAAPPEEVRSNLDPRR